MLKLLSYLLTKLQGNGKRLSIFLPHKSTLLKYTGFTNMSTGYNYDVIKKFVDDIKLSALREHEKNVSLLFDETKIKSG